MREIKFRAYWKPGKVMIENRNIESINFETKVLGVYHPIGEIGFHRLRMSDFGLMQFTGLLDRNGKEIYEGDILHVSSELLTNFGRTRTGKMSNSYYEVKWVEDSWGYTILKSDSLVASDKQMTGLKIPTQYGVVCGNIHEHPELLDKP